MSEFEFVQSKIKNMQAMLENLPDGKLPENMRSSLQTEIEVVLEKLASSSASKATLEETFVTQGDDSTVKSKQPRIESVEDESFAALNFKECKVPSVEDNGCLPKLQKEASELLKQIEKLSEEIEKLSEEASEEDCYRVIRSIMEIRISLLKGYIELSQNP